MTSDTQTSEAPASRRWRPLESIERRVLGVLVEKAKTTPEAYPLSLNALRTGCNQKNNRAPLMQLEESQVEDACEQLRKSGAISQVQGSSRVDRYRHLAYEWLGVEKVELAVMAELLLRGAQTVGELRGRAARMEPIKDLGELQPTLDSLAAKGLIHVPDAARPRLHRYARVVPRPRDGKGPPRGRCRPFRRALGRTGSSPTSVTRRQRPPRLACGSGREFYRVVTATAWRDEIESLRSSSMTSNASWPPPAPNSNLPPPTSAAIWTN